MTDQLYPGGTPLPLRTRQKLQTREALLSVATEVFGRKGYFETSVEDITAAAGTSRATLYVHFSGKEGLLAEIIERMMSDVQVSYGSFGDLQDWSRSSIHCWVRDFANDWQRDFRRNKIATYAALPQVVERRPLLHRQLVGLIRARPDMWHHFENGEADARASMIVHLLQGEFPNFFFHGDRSGLDAFIDYITDAVRDLLRADIVR